MLIRTVLLLGPGSTDCRNSAAGPCFVEILAVELG